MHLIIHPISPYIYNHDIVVIFTTENNNYNIVILAYEQDG